MHGYGEFLWNEGKNFMDFIRMIKRMDLEYIIGLIINFIQAFGSMENRMELGNILKIIVLNMGDGKMAKKKIQSLLKKNFLIVSIHLKQTLLIFFSGRKKELKIL